MTIERAEIPERRPHGFGSKTAILYRMIMSDHLCPFGLKSKDLLERQGFAVEDRHLEPRDETEAFKKEHGVETTPQTFIGGERIGGYRSRPTCLASPPR